MLGGRAGRAAVCAGRAAMPKDDRSLVGDAAEGTAKLGVAVS